LGIFQGNSPVLAGVDARSTYCFLLEEAEHRDEDTWGYYLLEAEERGLNPECTIADGGKGIRAGQKAAWGDKPCHGDLWHIFDQGEALCRHLTKKAQGATTRREERSYKGIKALRKALSKQSSVLLAFAAILDQKLQEIAQAFDTSLYLIRSVCLLTKHKTSSVDYWQEWNRLHHLLPNKFHLILEAVSGAMATTPRTSSLVENLNSRLRNYFFLRKQLSSDYLDLLRFFLHHGTFIRSRHSERVVKSPTELMTGQAHPHWLVCVTQNAPFLNHADFFVLYLTI